MVQFIKQLIIKLKYNKMKDIQIKITVDELKFIKGIMHCHSQRVWDEAGKYNRKNETQDEIAKLYIKEHFNTEDLLNKLNIYNTEN